MARAATGDGAGAPGVEQQWVGFVSCLNSKNLQKYRLKQPVIRHPPHFAAAVWLLLLLPLLLLAASGLGSRCCCCCGCCLAPCR